MDKDAVKSAWAFMESFQKSIKTSYVRQLTGLICQKEKQQEFL